MLHNLCSSADSAQAVALVRSTICAPRQHFETFAMPIPFNNLPHPLIRIFHRLDEILTVITTIKPNKRVTEETALSF